MSEEQQKGMTYEEAGSEKAIGTVNHTRGFRGFTPHSTLLEGEIVDTVYRGEVVDTLKMHIANLEMQLEGYKGANAKLEEIRAQKHPIPGWFLARNDLSDGAANTLTDLIRRAKQCSVCDVDLRENGKNVAFEADWVKYMRVVGPAQSFSDQSWVVKLGTAASNFKNPCVVEGKTQDEEDEIIKRLMKDLGQPQSHSLKAAFKQFSNELFYSSESLLNIVQKAAGNEGTIVWGESPTDVGIGAVDGQSRTGDPTDPDNLTPRPVRTFGTMVRAAPVADESGVVREQYPPAGTVSVETAAQHLDDLSKLQRAVIMFLHGTPVQKEEALVFLKTFFRDNYGYAKLLGINTEWAGASGIREEDVIR